MDYKWLFFAVIAGLSSDIYNILNRKALKDWGDSSSYSWWYEITRVGVFLLALPFGFYFFFTFRNIFTLVILGLTEFISVYVFMKMHAYVEVSVSSVIAKLRLVWTPIAAFLFLGETLGILEYLGILIVFSGLIITVSPKKFILDRGIKFALLSSLVVPLISVLLKITSDFSSIPVQMIFMGLPSVFIFPAIVKGWENRIVQSFKTSYREIFIATIFNCSAMVFLIIAFKIGSVGKVATVYQSMTLFSVLAGIILLGEKRDVWKKFAGSIITLLGVYLLV